MSFITLKTRDGWTYLNVAHIRRVYEQQVDQERVCIVATTDGAFSVDHSYGEVCERIDNALTRAASNPAGVAAGAA